MNFKGGDSVKIGYKFVLNTSEDGNPNSITDFNLLIKLPNGQTITGNSKDTNYKSSILGYDTQNFNVSTSVDNERIDVSLRYVGGLPILSNSTDTKLTITTNGDKIISKLVDAKGNPISNKKITVKVGNKTYTATTNSNGEAIIQDKNANKSILTGSFAGDSMYNPSSAKLNNRKGSQISYEKDGDKIKVILTDDDGNPIKNKKL